MVSKVNTGLQLLLMGITTASPLLPDIGLALQGLQYVSNPRLTLALLQFLLQVDSSHDDDLEWHAVSFFQRRGSGCEPRPDQAVIKTRYMGSTTTPLAP